MSDDDTLRSSLMKVHDLVIAGREFDGSTTQPANDPFVTDTPENAIVPPVPLSILQKLSQMSGTRTAVIEAIARNTVGLGYDAEPVPGLENDLGEEPSTLRRQVVTSLEALAARDKRLDAPTFTELLMAVKKDEEGCGWGFLEVSRNRLTGEIDGLFHVPGHRMRRLRDRSGFVLMPSDPTAPGLYLPDGSSAATEFYNFGEKVRYKPGDDKNPAEPLPELKPNHSWTTNEVIPFRLYTSESRDYGLPRDAALSLEYLGDKLAAEQNVSFFESSGTPPTVIFVQGQEQRDGNTVTFRVPQETVTRIGQSLKSDGGHMKRVSIVPLPPGTDVKEVQLGQVSDRDMGFVTYRGDNTRRIMGAFRISRVFITTQTGDARATAEVERALSLEQVFDPEQTRYEERIRQTILNDLGFGNMQLRFKRLAVEGDAAKRQAATALTTTGSITNGEYREANGYTRLPESDTEDEIEAAKTGKVPKGWNDKLVEPTGKGSGGVMETTQRPDQRGQDPGLGGREAQTPQSDPGDPAQDPRTIPGTEAHAAHKGVIKKGDLEEGLTDAEIAELERLDGVEAVQST